jgi:ubiquinone/menaquinone biosynthesis C-methylase UbiE
MTFWDFCAPFYDFAERRNGRAYGQMIKTVRELVPQGARVLELAGGTGAISLSVADKASSVLCTDISARMLAVAKKKADKRGVANITFSCLNIFNTGKPDNAFDVVIASQVLHLIDEPEKAAAELRRVTKDMVILPITLTQNLKGAARAKINFFKLLGFVPKLEFDVDSYATFIDEVGFKNCEFIAIDGEMPMSIAVWSRD